MNEDNVTKLIEEIEELWPGMFYDYTYSRTEGKKRGEPKQKIMWIWRKKLSKCDYKRAQHLINELYSRWDKDRNPKSGVLFSVLRQARLAGQKQNDPVLLYELIRPGQPKGIRIFHNNEDAPAGQEIEQMAEWTRQHFANIYDGQWIIIRHWESDHFEMQTQIETDQTNWGPIRCWLEDKIWRRGHHQEPGATITELVNQIKMPE